MKNRVAIVGITGITGEELLYLLEKDLQTELVAVFSRSSTQKLAQLYNFSKRFAALDIQPYSIQTVKSLNLDLIFLALPHGEAMDLVPDLLAANVRVIDLGADFRLKSKPIFEKWYLPHRCWNYVDQAVYGMAEFAEVSDWNKVRLLANPGCYVTAATVALKPLLALGLIQNHSILIDAKSGYSGGGRKLEEAVSQWQQNFKPYGVSGHRHRPEIEQNLGVGVTFVPHLLSLYRGMLVSCYAVPTPGQNLESVRKTYAEWAKTKPFVRLLEQAPEIKNVIGTNQVHIYIGWDEEQNRVLIFSALDNLVKGASGQAFQNMNLMLGRAEQYLLCDLEVLSNNAGYDRR